MKPDFSHIFFWDRCGRKGQPCRVLARPIAGRGKASFIAFGLPKAKNLNSVAVEFADGFTLVTSGRALRRRMVV